MGLTSVILGIIALLSVGFLSVILPPFGHLTAIPLVAVSIPLGIIAVAKNKKGDDQVGRKIASADLVLSIGVLPLIALQIMLSALSSS